MAKEIKITRGQFVLVDDSDYGWLSEFKWQALKDRAGKFYAVRNSLKADGTPRSIRMHRAILGLQHGDKQQGDHWNHNTLDNRRKNLRVCTSQENCRNQNPMPGFSSKYKGVSWHKQNKIWRVGIRIEGKKKHLGCFLDEAKAAQVYDDAAIKYYGAFASLNHIGK
jgi:hypothetical protein